MKDFEEYKKEHTPVDWVIRDLIIANQELRNDVKWLKIAGIILSVALFLSAFIT